MLGHDDVIVPYHSSPNFSYLNKCHVTINVYGLDDQDLIPGRGWDFLLPCPDWLWGPPSLPSNGYLGVKWPGHEADNSPQCQDQECLELYFHPQNMSSWHGA